MDHRSACRLLILLALLGPACLRHAAAQEPEQGAAATGSLTRSDFILSGRFAYHERDVEEYDDRYRISGASGSAEILSLLAELSYTGLPHVELAVRAGLASVDLTGFGSRTYEHDYDLGPAWGFGLSSMLPVAENAWDLGVKVFFDFNHFRPDDWASREPLVKYEARIDEWRLGAMALADFGALNGYAGVQYSDFVVDYEHPFSGGGTREGGFEATDNIGLFAGGTYEIRPRLHASARLHAIDTVGIATELSYRF
jgi:hypothetical protein